MKQFGRLVRHSYFVLCFAALLTLPCAAYIDPATTSTIMYLIPAIAVAVGTTVSILWRQVRKKLQDKFGIDENSKKELEPPIEIYDSYPELDALRGDAPAAKSVEQVKPRGIGKPCWLLDIEDEDKVEYVYGELQYEQ